MTMNLQAMRKNSKKAKNSDKDIVEQYDLDDNKDFKNKGSNET